MVHVIDVLRDRGLLEATTADAELRERLKTPRKIYCGLDPTSDSLHLGNLVPLMVLAWLQRFGHTPVVVLGGATGMIGDPSGKSTERSLLDEETIKKNVKGIRKNVEPVLDFQDSSCAAIILNNYDWFKTITFIHFLREIGKHFRLGTMLAKESVKTRLQSEEGLSYTEFSYQLLQGYDFLYLYDNHGVEIQLGGSDQWGNITAGTELIRKVRGVAAYGLTFPLLIRSDGQKFGKSEKGAIWLSPERLSPYEFYQYLVRITDADVIRLMRMITFMPLDEIQNYEEQMRRSDYVPNTAQKHLAMEVTRIVHGEEALTAALKITQTMAPGADTVLDPALFEQPGVEIPRMRLSSEEVYEAKLVDLLVKTGLQESKGQARRLIQNGGVYLNNKQVIELDRCITMEDIVNERFLLLSVGKKNKLVIQIGGKEEPVQA